ncbi:hypothetical protein [Paraburkholderia sp. SIMBA_054]|uniref:hypothetical protein n=1 Tax=Paraburkholderia sp. SIMBA_054 TaxID=3085795 RepID=UPI003977EF74
MPEADALNMPAGLNGASSKAIVGFVKTVAMMNIANPLSEEQLKDIEKMGRQTLTDAERATLRRIALAWFAE